MTFLLSILSSLILFSPSCFLSLVDDYGKAYITIFVYYLALDKQKLLRVTNDVRECDEEVCFERTKERL